MESALESIHSEILTILKTSPYTFNFPRERVTSASISISGHQDSVELLSAVGGGRYFDRLGGPRRVLTRAGPVCEAPGPALWSEE